MASAADLASRRRLTTCSRLLRYSSLSSLSSSRSLLSGASRGFGLAIALSLGKAGCKGKLSGAQVIHPECKIRGGAL
ncbi:uncharacterized protein G2W53_041469 [Senna tora]|uniref:Uncharacterized protein n=1 Tax=Senna tora TaxID=362788 RepID=A0A834SEV4_9FABA|nr:uncharacterized protein G2W53_041469 [Senna tora]